MPILSQSITFSGAIHENLDISAIAHFEINGTSYLAIGSDESLQEVQLLKQTGDGIYEVDNSLEIHLPVAKQPDEIDIEGIAFDPNSHSLYIAGSHSKKRKTVKVQEETVKTNRKRLKTISPETHRNRVFRVKLKPETGQVKGKIERSKNLKDLLAKDPYLQGFVDLPSKENGIDIEGLAIQGKYLFLGFRGPILRGNYVPVMMAKFGDFKDYELRFVQLEGNGIRDITAVKDGFLIISGPMGDAPGPYKICFWNGEDMVYGSDRCPTTPPALIQLEEIDLPISPDGSQGKAEGITVLSETDEEYRAIIIYDSLKNGHPQLWQIKKPGC